MTEHGRIYTTNENGGLVCTGIVRDYGSGLVIINPDIKPYIATAPTLHYLGHNPARGKQYYLRFGRKELLITEEELELLKKYLNSSEMTDFS